LIPVRNGGGLRANASETVRFLDSEWRNLA
jgi:hypothetical protein